MNPTHQFETKITFSGVERSDAVVEYVDKKLESAKKILAGERRGFSGIFRVDMARTSRHHRTGDVFRAEIGFTGGRIRAFAMAERDDLYAALDRAKDELDRELRSVRKRRITRKKQGGMAFKNMTRGFGMGGA